MYKGFIFLLLGILLGGCSTHRTAMMGWQNDRIAISIYPPGGSTLFSQPALRCLSCNNALPPIPLEEDIAGIATVKIDEVSNSIASHFHLEGAGIDTALTLQPIDPEDATVKYKLNPPLTGRILITELAVVYADTTMQKRITALSRADEANLFSETEVFYYIHHPAISHPVVVLRSQAIRLR